MKQLAVKPHLRLSLDCTRPLLHQLVVHMLQATAPDYSLPAGTVLQMIMTATDHLFAQIVLSVGYRAS